MWVRSERNGNWTEWHIHVLSWAFPPVGSRIATNVEIKAETEIENET